MAVFDNMIYGAVVSEFSFSRHVGFCVIGRVYVEG
jgi:hypothetical protein